MNKKILIPFFFIFLLINSSFSISDEWQLTEENGEWIVTLNDIWESKDNTFDANFTYKQIEDNFNEWSFVLEIDAETWYLHTIWYNLLFTIGNDTIDSFSLKVSLEVYRDFLNLKGRDLEFFAYQNDTELWNYGYFLAPEFTYTDIEFIYIGFFKTSNTELTMRLLTANNYVPSWVYFDFSGGEIAEVYISYEESFTVDSAFWDDLEITQSIEKISSGYVKGEKYDEIIDNGSPIDIPEQPITKLRETWVTALVEFLSSLGAILFDIASNLFTWGALFIGVWFIMVCGDTCKQRSLVPLGDFFTKISLFIVGLAQILIAISEIAFNVFKSILNLISIYILGGSGL